jgi:hypothetical protein
MADILPLLIILAVVAGALERNSDERLIEPAA